MTWATVPLKQFSWTRGEPSAYCATSHGTRYFCPLCGAQLALFTTKSPRSVDVSIATLDRPDLYPPNRHIWVGRKLKWIALPRDVVCEKKESL